MTSVRSRTGSTVALGLLLVALLAFPAPVFASSDLDFRIKPESDELTAQLILHDLEEALNSPTEAGLERLAPTIADWNTENRAHQSRTKSVLSELTATPGKVWVQPSRVEKSGDSVIVYAQIFHEANGLLFRDSTQFVFRHEAKAKGVQNRLQLATSDPLLEQVNLYRTAAAEKGRVALQAATTEERTPLLDLHPDSISHHMFVQKAVNPDFGVGVLSASTKGTVSGLDVDLFNQPYGLWPFYYEEFIGSTTTKRITFMACSDASWDRIIVSGRAHHGSGYNILDDFCSNGSGDWGVKRPTGIAWARWSLYVADSYNDRVQQFTYNTLTDPPEVVYDRTIDYDFDTPVDVAGAELWTWGGDDVYKTVAILDQGNNRVCVEWTYGYAYQHAFYPNDPINFTLDHPTSICFGRNGRDHSNNQRLYVTDAGNNRVVTFVHQKPYPTCVLVNTTPAGFFPEDAFLTSVEVDDYGDVYVLDGHNATIYKLDWSLSQFYGKFGTSGTGPEQFTYPHRLAIMHSGRYETSEDYVTYGNIGEAVVSEMWTSGSGIRRYGVGYDVLAQDIDYHPACTTYTGDPSRDYLIVRWFQSGTALGSLRVTQGTGSDSILTLPDTYFPAGERVCYVSLEDAAPSGQYDYEVDLRSPFNPTDTRIVTGSINIDRYAASNCPPRYRYGFDSAFIEPADRSNCTGPECDMCLYPNSGTRTVRVYAYDSLMAAPVDENYHYTWTSALSPSVEFICYNPFPTMCDTAVTEDPWVQFTISSFPAGHSSGAMMSLIHVDIQRNEEATGQGARKGDQTNAALDVSFEPLSIRARLYTSYAATPCYTPPSGCPFLYAWNGAEYEFVNNILPQSEELTDTLSEVSDSYPLLYIKPVDSFYYKLLVTEEEHEETKVEDLQLQAFDVPVPLKDFCLDNHGEVAILLDSIAPLWAITDQGTDVTKVLAKRDGEYYQAVGDGWIDLTYDFSLVANAAALSPQDQDDPIVIADPDPPGKNNKRSPEANESFKTGFYRVFVRDADENWQLQGMFCPRVQNSRNAITVPTGGSKGKLAIRLEWTGAIALDALYCYPTKRESVTPVKLQLVEAKHTGEGVVTGKVDKDDGVKQRLVPGDSLFLTYYADPPSRSTQRVFMFTSKGNYRTLTDEELSRLENPTSAAFSFEQNYPNPFNPVTTFNFALPSAQHVTLEVFNILGQKVVTLIDAPYSAGPHTFEWNSSAADGSPVASGVYFAKFTAGDFQASKKMVVVK